MILPARFEEGGPKDSVPRLLRNALGVTKRLRAAKSNEKKTRPLCCILLHIPPLRATLGLTKGLYSKAIAQLQAPPREALRRALARNQGKRYGL